jgi:hypothetical protein
MFFHPPMHRTAIVGVLVGFVFPLLRLGAQAPPVPDSTVVYMLSPSLFQLVDFEIAGAALGRRYVVRVEVPEGQLWSRVASHLMKITNARGPTSKDSVVMVVAISDIHLAADTLVARLVKETRELCPGTRWMSTGTSYEVRTLREKGVRDAWTQPTVTPKLSWDAFGCPATP